MWNYTWCNLDIAGNKLSEGCQASKTNFLALQASGSIKDQVGPCTLRVPPLDQPPPSFHSMIIKNSLKEGEWKEGEGRVVKKTNKAVHSSFG